MITRMVPGENNLTTAMTAAYCGKLRYTTAESTTEKQKHVFTTQVDPSELHSINMDPVTTVRLQHDYGKQPVKFRNLGRR